MPFATDCLGNRSGTLAVYGPFLYIHRTISDIRGHD
jgi:hypothetical protein